MTTTFRVIAVPPERLEAMRDSGRDDLGNEFRPHPAQGWEPLRCCLCKPAPGESIALISYRPMHSSVWSEIGPVFVHADRCAGYDESGGLPEQMRTGPRVLRTYRADGSLDYEHIVLVPEAEDIEQSLQQVLDEPGVAVVHVRTACPQCFHFEVRR